MNSKMIVKWGDGNISVSNSIGELKYTVAIGTYSDTKLDRIECHMDDLSDGFKELDLFNHNADACIWEDNGRYEFSYHIGETDIAFVKMDKKTNFVNIVYLYKKQE